MHQWPNKNLPAAPAKWGEMIEHHTALSKGSRLPSRFMQEKTFVNKTFVVVRRPQAGRPQEIRRDLGLGELIPGPGELYSKFRQKNEVVRCRRL